MNVLVSVFSNRPEVAKGSHHDLTQGRVNGLRSGQRPVVLLLSVHQIHDLRKSLLLELPRTMRSRAQIDSRSFSVAFSMPILICVQRVIFQVPGTYMAAFA